MKRKNVLLFGVGGGVSGVIGAVTMPITAWVMSPADVGKLSLLQVVLSLGVVLFGLGFDQSLARDYHAYRGGETRLFFSALSPSLIFLSVISSVCLLMAPTSISEFLFEVPSVGLSSLVLVCVAFALFVRFGAVLLRMQQRGAAFSVIQIAPKLLFLIFLFAAYAFGLQTAIDAAVSYQTASMLIAAILAALYLTPLLQFRARVVDYKLIIPMALYGLPLMVSGALSWGLFSLDRALLRQLSTYDELAKYSVVMSIAAGVVMITNLLGTLWWPQVYKWVGSDKNLPRLESVLEFALAAATLAFCSAGFFSWMAPLFLPHQYASIASLIPVCVGASLCYFLSEFTSVGINISRKTWMSLIASLGAFAVSFVLNIYLIPVLGGRGSAISGGVAFFTFLLLRTELSVTVWRPFPRIRVYVLMSTLLVMAMLHSWLGERFIILFSVMWFIVGAGSVYLFWPQYMDAFHRLRLELGRIRGAKVI